MPLKVHNTCECGHYGWAHTGEGCPVFENKYERRGLERIFFGAVKCECKKTYESFVRAEQT